MPANNLAYIDSVRSGLVPCRPIQLTHYGMKVCVTANRGAYKRGEIVELTLSLIIPRKAVHYRMGIPRIMRYTWYVDEHNTIRFVIG